MMNMFDLAVKIISDSLKDEIEQYDPECESYSEFLEFCYDNDSKALKEDVNYILMDYCNKKDISPFFFDDLSIGTENGDIKSYRQLMLAVKKSIFVNN